MRKHIIPGLMTVVLTSVSTIALAQTTSQSEKPAATTNQPAQAERMTDNKSTTGTVGLLVIKVADAEKWVGKRVYSSDGSDIGEISAYHAGDSGVVDYFHTDIGGFLGIGETSVQVKPDQFDMRDEKLYLNMTKDQALKLPRVTK